MTAEILIQKLDSHAALSDADRALLRGLPIHQKTLAARQDIASQGSVPEHSVTIIEGTLVRYQELTDDGERQTVSFHFPGETPDLHSTFIHRMDHTLATLTDATIGYIRHDDIRRMLSQSYTLAEVMWRETLIDAAIFRQWIANNGKRGAHDGTAHLICELITRAKAVGLFAQDGTWRMPFTQQHLADALGISLVHINRTLRTLRHSELVSIDAGHLLRILNWERLVQLAGFDPTYLHLQHEHNVGTGRVDA